MPILTTRDFSCDLTEHVVSGRVSDTEMFACQAEFYEGSPTRLQLWDMSGTDLTEITSDGLKRFIQRAALLGRVRPGGRTAVVVHSPLQVGLGRMAQAFGENAALPYELRFFGDRAEALDWLNREEAA